MRGLALWMALFASPALAQVESTVQTRKILTGIESYQDIGGVLVVPESSKPKLETVGYIEVENDAAIIRVSAENLNREPVETKSIDRTHFLVIGKGRVWLTITCVDFDKQIFDQIERQITIGPDEPEPDKPDEPDQPDEPDTPDDSDVPSDAFDDLGKRIDALADLANLQFDKRQRIAEIYQGIADRMASLDIKRTSDAVDQLNLQLATFSVGAEWKPVFDLLRRDGGSRPALTFAQTIDWYKAVAAGFRG